MQSIRHMDLTFKDFFLEMLKVKLEKYERKNVQKYNQSHLKHMETIAHKIHPRNVFL